LVQLDKEQAIMVRELESTVQRAPQDNQLLSNHGILGLEARFRLRWRDYNGQNEIEQPKSYRQLT
jgi:hypothetical protein